MFIVILGIISNTGATATDNIQDQFDRLSCPMPSQTGLWNNSGVITYSGATYNYEDVSTPVLTLTCTSVHTLDGVDYLNGQPLAPVGALYYVGDYISEIFANKLVAIFTLIGYILTPANFDILGYTLTDITGIALLFIIGLYSFAYIAIGIFLYKSLSPFAGLS